ncbi:MAG: ribosome silencing factor, partial [Rhodospirillales bacterium]|nr:ribosome silencing factor [Rhodospirillales bacterium]
AATKASLDDDKAQDVVVINLAGKTSFADYMVIATGTSQRQVVTMAQHLQKNLKAEGLSEVPLEGVNQGDWVLIDGGDIVVHLFRSEIREFYDLEKIWGAAMPQPDQVA